MQYNRNGNKLTEAQIKFLQKVEREGKNKLRYDLLKYSNTWNSEYDTTDSILVYRYNQPTGEHYVIIFKQRGEYIDYIVR